MGEAKYLRPMTALLLILTLSAWGCSASGLSLYAVINMDGLDGSLHFTQETENSNVTIEVNLRSFKSEPINYTWAVTANLISYSDKDRCNKRTIGQKVYDFTLKHGKLSVSPDTPTTLTFQDDSITLYGSNTIWEKSILLEGTSSVCGNILSADPVRVSEAMFTSPIAGSIMFRQLYAGSATIPLTRITVDLFHVGSTAPIASNHDWKILVTDILDTRSEDRRAGFCNHLTVLYDPDNTDDSNCSSTAHAKVGASLLTPICLSQIWKVHGTSTWRFTAHRFPTRS